MVSATTSAQLVDINNDSEESLAKLPGIGPILAKKAISNRQKNGGFRTVEDFAAALELKPHIIERLRTLVVVGEIADVQLPLLKGRVVDF